MKKLSQADIIQVMREEWNARTSALVEQAGLTVTSKVDDSVEPILAPELKVRHKKSQIRYTICSVGPRDIILRTPEGEQFLVDQPTIERDYELD
jgi:hypothetical protein